MKEDALNTIYPPAVIARYHHLFHRVHSNAILSRRYAVGHQALCLVLLQDYEDIRH
jgi:hypothetical protein